MEQSANFAVAQFIGVFVFLIMLLGCGALWRRLFADKSAGKAVGLVAIIAGALPVFSLVVWTVAPAGAFDINGLYLIWLLALLVSCASLLARVPRTGKALFVGLSTGCVLSFLGAIVGAMLD